MRCWYSDEYLLKNIGVKENGEGLVDVKKRVRNIKVKRSNVLRAKRGTGKVFVRETVTDMLRRATWLLPQGYSIIIYDGYRDEKTQKIYFQNYLRKLKKQNASWSEKKLKKKASRYVADPKGFCPHLTGGAVDVSLAKGKRQIAMGGFIGKDKKVTKRVLRNRKMLAGVMEKAGFVNYPLEWWHWSYGDRYWAAVKKEKYAVYDELRNLTKNI